MDSLDWLRARRLHEVRHRAYDWLFIFDADCQLVVTCLWRLIEASRVELTSEDHDQRFGLPAPVNAAAELSRRIGGATVTSVVLREGSLDLELEFDSGPKLQVIPTSSGYEAWNAYSGPTQFIAMGGGELAVIQHGVRQGT
jgi:hypothetical protein